MTQSEDYCVVLTTTDSQEEADRLARELVAQRLAACVQITGITSYYTWNNQVNHDPELLLLIKTARSKYAEVETFISQNHSYDVPEIVQLPIVQGLGAYLGWISETTK